MKNIVLIPTLVIAVLASSERSLAQSIYQTPAEIAPYVNFLEEQKLSAKDYILSLYDKYDIIIFGERTHDEMTQYELLLDIMADKRFKEKVGHVFVEIGGSNFDTEYNNYLFTENLTKEQSIQRALEIQRNMCWYPLWERYNYHYLLTSLYEINKPLSKEEKISLHPADIAMDWKSIVSLDDVKNGIIARVQNGRDSVMGANITSYISQLDASDTKRKKYFIILNIPHAVKGTWLLGNHQEKSAATYIFEKFGDRVANVMINLESLLNIYSTSAGLPEALPIIDGKWDASFEYLGIDDLGFDVKGSPLENVRFENLIMLDSTLTYKEVYSGYIFYKSFSKQEGVNGVPGIVDEEFKTELIRRRKLWTEALFNTTFSEKELVDYTSAFNVVKKKNSAGLSGYWQKVMYWIGGGKQIVAFYSTAKSIDEVVSFINDERAKGSKSEYNVMESGLNQFGGYLMRRGEDNDALTIFKLNTELYPDAYNTHDSYGECLLKLGRKEEALEAYKKSLELNPHNGQALKLLETSNK